MFESEFIKRLEMLSERLVVSSLALDHLNCDSLADFFPSSSLYPVANMISNTSRDIQILLVDMFKSYKDNSNKDSSSKIEPLTEA